MLLFIIVTSIARINIDLSQTYIYIPTYVYDLVNIHTHAELQHNPLTKQRVFLIFGINLKKKIHTKTPKINT